MADFERIAQKEIADYKFFSVVTNTTQVEGEIFDRTSITHIGAVAVVPILKNGDIVLINQYRATIDEYSLEAVAGRRDVDGEDPLECARRELEEEVGVKSKRIESAGWIYTSPGFTNERLYLYVAFDCDEPAAPQPVGIEEKYSEVIRCSFDQALQWIEQGKIVDAKSVIAIQRAYKATNL